MTVNRGLFVRQVGTVGTTPKEARLALAGLLAEDSPGVPRQGLLTQDEPIVVVGSGGWSYTVRACNPVIHRAAGDGVYLPTFTGDTPVPTTVAPGSGFRYDLIWAKQNNPDAPFSDPDNTAVLGVTQGIDSSSPAKPYASVPDGAYVLAESLVPSGSTDTNGATITQVWQHTAARGAPIPVRDTAERGALSPAAGDMVRRLDRAGLIEPYVDGVWGTRDRNVTFNTGWGNVATELPLRVERSPFGAMSLQGYVRRVSGTSNTIGTVTNELFRPRRDITWTAVAENDSFAVGPSFRLYLNASTGALSITRLTGGPAFDNNTTKIPVSAAWVA